jgi:molybdopterin-guanine dinucleotide biosynthesis protein A
MNKDITAIILAGGRGSRFNNQDKGLITWQQKPFVEHVIERLKPQVKTIVINCNRNIEAYKALNYPVCVDSLDDFQGPLAGVHAALPLVKTPLAIVCPVDSPRLPENLVDLLYQRLSSEHADITYPHDGERDHFLPFLFKTELADSLSDYLNTDDRRVRRWFQQQHCVTTDCSNIPEAFHNINDQNSLLALDQTD